jgi:hypothetical protein
LLPDEPSALLERGLLHLMDGNTVGAAIDWNTIIAGQPASPAAELARQNLSMLSQ